VRPPLISRELKNLKELHPTLVRWYRRGEDPARRLPVLSTYLGHAHVTDTYWYLTNTPELMAAAGKLLEKRWRGVI
jgi:integrase/recombinase XerD